MSSESSSDSDMDLIESKAHIKKKKFNCKIGNIQNK